MTTLDRKPWPLHGYAPGNYTCRCHTCDKQFVGDKRATTCLECAVIEAKDALSSLPAQAVGVKALEWFTELDHLAVAISPVGVWRVWNNLVLETPAPQTTKRYDNLDDAKAAAQADYEARILSALVAPSQPAAVGVTDEMVERVSVPYDGFTGDVIGSYTTREGKHGVVVQQDGTRVVHVYGRSRVEAALRGTP